MSKDAKRQAATRCTYELRELNIPVEQVVDTIRMPSRDWEALDKEVQKKADRILKSHNLFISFTI